MLLHADPLEYLAAVRRAVCARHTFSSLDCPDCQARARVGKTPLDLASGGKGVAKPAKDSPHPLRRLRETTCQRCQFDVLLEAIQQTLCPELIPDWMEAPNLDLEGQSPLYCIQQGQFDEVFDALWLMGEPGPCS